MLLPSEEYTSVSVKKKEFEDLDVLLVSFRVRFVIVGDTYCTSTMYYA
jgi:hypothetical protein